MTTKRAKTKKKTTTSAVTDRALFDLAAQFENAKSLSKKYEADPAVGWRSIQRRLVDELKRRKVKSLTDSSLTTITLVAPESVVYNSDGIWADLPSAKRKKVFDQTIDLSLLPRDVQVALLEHLTPAQRKRVVKHTLNVDRLAEAVQDGVVTAEFVAKHSEIKESAPYVRVSHGEVQ